MSIFSSKSQKIKVIGRSSTHRRSPENDAYLAAAGSRASAAFSAHCTLTLCSGHVKPSANKRLCLFNAFRSVYVNAMSALLE